MTGGADWPGAATWALLEPHTAPASALAVRVSPTACAVAPYGLLPGRVWRGTTPSGHPVALVVVAVQPGSAEAEAELEAALEGVPIGPLFSSGPG